MHFDKVGFIGLGLIGGSLASKMKENKAIAKTLQESTDIFAIF